MLASHYAIWAVQGAKKEGTFFPKIRRVREGQGGHHNTQTWLATAFVAGKEIYEEHHTLPSISGSSIIFQEGFTHHLFPSKYLLCKVALVLWELLFKYIHI